MFFCASVLLRAETSVEIDLQEQMAALHGQLVGLCSSWRDQEQLKFTEEFEQTMQVLERFVAATEQHIPFLMRKAERAEEYLQQR